MTQHVPVAQQDALANRETLKPLPEISTLTALKRYIIKSATIIGLEIRKIRHDPTDLFTRAIQPMLWLLIFGEVLARAIDGPGHVGELAPPQVAFARTGDAQRHVRLAP